MSTDPKFEGDTAPGEERKFEGIAAAEGPAPKFEGVTVPPKFEGATVPPKFEGVIVPPKFEGDIAPSEAEGDIAPSGTQSAAAIGTPPPQFGGVVAEDTLPPKFEG
jgi:hypothetical protein